MTRVTEERAAAPPGRLPSNGDRRRLVDLGLLYASKSGAIVVGLLILPLFNRMLGSELFGFVALIFSLQAFLVVLDFGMSTMVGRDLAIADATPAERFTTWRAAEWAVSLVYAVLTPPTLLAAWAWDGPLGIGGALGCLVLFWSLTLQNIGQSALLARHRFTEAALIQVTGVLARNGFTALALAWLSPSLICFTVAQAAVAVAQMLATRWRCNAALRPEGPDTAGEDARARSRVLLRTGRPLMVFGLAGAAVMQLDKAIVSGFMSPRDLAPYFLAVTFCLAPLSVLAAPVAQFFQPRLVRAASTGNPVATRRSLHQFIRCLVVCTLLPTAAIWLLREPLIAVWLHHSPDAALVARYSAVLLPGAAFGALGYVPYIMLLSHRDYQFQARFSMILTSVTLSAALVAAVLGSVLTVCAVYSLYHSASTAGSWWRWIRLDSARGGAAAPAAMHAAIATLLVICGTGGLVMMKSEISFFK
jgi:O-antigen/teichoic acid export membrane protein